jgi:hypothetical protein
MHEEQELTKPLRICSCLRPAERELTKAGISPAFAIGAERSYFFSPLFSLGISLPFGSVMRPVSA